MRSNPILIIIAIVVLNLSYAKNMAKQTATSEIMNKIFDSFVALLPYMTNEVEFTEKKSFETAKKHVTQIADSFTKAHNEKLQGPGFAPSREVMINHLKETLDTLNKKNSFFSQQRIKSIGSICMSCHTQLPSHTSISFKKRAEKININQFSDIQSYGDFLFVTRQYRKASEIYIKDITQRLDKLKNKEVAFGTNDFDMLYKGVKKLVIIFAKTELSLKLLKQQLSKIQTHPNCPQGIKSDVDYWLGQLKKTSQLHRPNNDKEAQKLIATKLIPLWDEAGITSVFPVNIQLLQVTGELLRFLEKNPASQIAPQILYWASVAERQIFRSYLYSLADIYLKQCITNFTASSHAVKCYEEYEDNIKFGYTGSSGTHIPADALEDLANLRLLIKKYHPNVINRR